MTKTKTAPRKRVSLAVLEQHKLHEEKIERGCRVELELLLTGCAKCLDSACTWIGPHGADADEVTSFVTEVIAKLAVVDDLLPRWRASIKNQDQFRKAWRNAGGEE